MHLSLMNRVLLDVDSQNHSGCDHHCLTEITRSFALGIESCKPKGVYFLSRNTKGGVMDTEEEGYGVYQHKVGQK